MTKIIEIGKALEILWGNYKNYCDRINTKSTFEGFMDWIASTNGYAGYPLENEVEDIRAAQS